MSEYLIYKGVSKVQGPLIFLEGAIDVGYDDIAEIRGIDGNIRYGRVLEAGIKYVMIEVFTGTSGLSLSETSVRFHGKPLEVRVSEKMLGRIFNGFGKPIDGGSEITHGELRDINSSPINPISREYPRESIQTGISGIDGLNTLVRGQKLPIFSGAGLPHSELAAQIARQATIIEKKEQFVVVFAAMGLKHATADFFKTNFEKSGAFKDVVMFLNLAEDPPTERLITPRIALTVAEYLAFKKDMHVLVILTDMTSYAEALREVSSAKGEIPSRKGYPGYLYTDLASIYERAGRIKGKKGTITQIPILTMPNDDIGHPIPDLTGYITEGQITLDRGLHMAGVYPPIDILSSLSRLMKSGIGKGLTREDHADLASQLYAAYAKAKEVESLANIIGADELSQLDRQYLKFNELFIQRYIKQGLNENRNFIDTLDVGWDVISTIPDTELTRIKDEYIEKYYRLGKVPPDKHI
ncbi:MAG: V-type ATP synthase subunit B [Candidatus Helarchaeota archaeon]